MRPLRNFVPSTSALVHLRFMFSIFLLPVYLFALSQAPRVIPFNAFVTFIVWHLLVYPASNGYNSYFDKDEESIALVKNPPPVDKSLYYFSLLLDFLGLVLALIISTELMLAVLLYGLFSKMYSHPSVRLKKYPVISFLIVFIFQGACIYWSSYSAVSGLSVLAGWNLNFTLAGLICSSLIGASYPLTQVYQHAEDKKRGDKTLSLLLGVRGSFIFSAILFAAAVLCLYIYWLRLQQLYNFWLFLFFALPVFAVFINWFAKVWKNEEEASYKNMSRMTLTSGLLMLLYFAILNFI